MKIRFYPNPLALLILSVALSGAGCAARAPMKVPISSQSSDSLDRLRADLDAIFSDPNFASAQWGVEVHSLDRGELIFERNSTRLYLPASNNKLLTAAAALVSLGPDFRLETRVYAGGPIRDGSLRGDLVIVGSGDPSTAARFHSGDPFAVFKEWAVILKEKGIQRIEGDLVGDDRAFGRIPYGRGWAWDDLGYGYAAPVTSLQFNENLVTATLTPAEREGEPAAVKIAPLDSYVKVNSAVVTGPPGSEESLEVDRSEPGETVFLRGSVPLKSEPAVQRISVRYPALYYLQALKQALGSEGIDVSGCTTRTTSAQEALRSDLVPLLTQKSATLIEIIRPLLKVSQNLYAETISRWLALAAGREGSFEISRGLVEQSLAAMGIEKGTYYYADGSGLSRRNLISADLLIRLFKHMYRSRHFTQFYDALPVAGVDGTISARMKGTRAENNVHAKTGTVAHVRSLSGYVRTADGEMLAFSMIANNFLASSKAAEYVQDAALERLSNFSRKQ